MMRTFILWAALAIAVAAPLAGNASACRARRGAECCHYAGGLASPSTTVLVRLPADAKVFFDDQPTTSTGPIRVFITPALEPGKDYTYQLKIEVVRGGKTATQTRTITVRAYSTTEVDFGPSTGGDAADSRGLPTLRDLPALPDSYFAQVEP